MLTIPARWIKHSMISAISPRGEVAFRIVEGTINAERFIAFLAALSDGAPRKIILAVDNLPVQHAKVVADWLANKIESDRIGLPASVPPGSQPQGVRQP